MSEPLFKNGRFMRLWAGQGVSFVGDAITMVALVVLVVDLTGSAVDVGGVLLARLLPTFAGPLVGVVADRLHDRRRLLVVVDLARAGLVSGMIFASSMPLLYALAFLLGLCQTLFNPTIRASFPGVVGGGDLTRANAVISGTFSCALAAGPALGGVIVAAAGVDAAFALDAATYLVSAALLTSVPMPRPPGGGEEANFLWELTAGLGYLRRARVPLAVVVGAGFLMLAENTTVPAEVFLAKQTLGVGDAGYGMLVATWGAGMVVGSGLMAALGDRARLLVWYLASVFAAAAALAATGLAPFFWAALCAFTLAGVCNGVDNVSTDALLQKRVSGPFLGRVYSVLFTARTAGESLALLSGGLLVEATGPRATYVFSAAAVAAVGLFVLSLLASSGRQAAL
ncbi:Enterobactin exporter EntS [Rubrobacter xylanophilus DSM 9941]|uniref:MFS transporter n=1 Tax=Rubrobacter xylanophilus TaxID=49319 RepID=UPI001C63D959|nr:MFS transporter [Rubrobacter xylanophilus]QYJ14241.1 Enterobactin exporter EntS [Rubrobacter xylanophilus DSM 9941]